MKKIILMIGLFGSLLFGQQFDGVGLSLAGNYMTMSRGVNALGWNPANLALKRGNTMELNLVSFNAAVFNNSFSINSYNRYFTAEGNGGFWSDSDKHNLLDAISSDGLRMDFDVNANILGLAFNNFAMAVQMIGKGYTQLSENKKPFQIVLFGETFDHTYTYNEPAQISAAAYSAMKLSLGYAYPVAMNWLHPKLRPLSVGFSLNQYVGIGVGETEKSRVMVRRIDGEEESIQYAVAIQARTATPEDGTPAGKGSGFDFGISGGYGSKIDFALSFSNIGASIEWSNHAQRMDIFYSDSVAILNDNSNEPSSEVEIDTTYDINSFRTPLPAILRLGAVYHFNPDWKVSVEYHQGLNTAFGNSTTPRFGTGTEYYLRSWLPLRAGIAVGGNEGFQFGLGFGLHVFFLHLDYAYALRGAIWPTYAKGVYTGLNIKIVL
jgi:hypothetical protein